MFVFVLDDFSLWPMTKCPYQSNHEVSLASTHFFKFAFSIPINWVKYVNLETLRKETENLEIRKKHENTAPHNHWKKGWAMVVFMRVLSERPPYTQKRNHHRLFTFCLLHDLSLLPGGSYIMVLFDNKSFKRVANVMLIYLLTWEMLRSHTGVHIF